MAKPGRKSWSPDDGVTRQNPNFTQKANSAPRKPSAYSRYHMMQNKKHGMDKPSYNVGRTRRCA